MFVRQRPRKFQIRNGYGTRAIVAGNQACWIEGGNFARQTTGAVLGRNHTPPMP
jgi:hypothetical protein